MSVQKPVQEPDTLAFQPIHTPGFLGVTSYSDVFDETRHRLSRLSAFPEGGTHHQERNAAQLDAIRVYLRTQPTRETCLHVLRTLRSVAAVNIPPLTHIAHDRWAASSAAAVLDKLLDGYAAYLRPDVADSQLEELAAQISQNTARPFIEDISDAQEWMAQFAGPNLRWESLALVYAYALTEMESKSASHGPRLRGNKVGTSQQWRETALTCLGICISLAQRLSGPNIILLRLCLKRTTEDSQISGDAGYPAWKGISETMSMLTFLGVHTETNTNVYLPSLASEIRRRVTAHVFSLDKACVLHTGRPPQLSRRYVSTPLPLDVADDDLRGDEATRRAALSSLDGAGWNTDGKLHEATLVRARFMISLVRDELIEVALSHGEPASIQALL